MLFNACAFVAGGPEPLEGLVRPRPSWSKGASGTIAPMKRRRAWKNSFASFWLIVFTCHIFLANKNREFFKFLKRLCQVFTPIRSELIVVGDVLNVEYELTVV